MSYQNCQILARLRQGPATTLELIESLKICSVTKRISELRRSGHVITSTQRHVGRKRIVTYTLEGRDPWAAK